MLITVAAIGLTASEAKVKQTVSDYQKLSCEMKLAEALALCSKDFKNYSAKGNVFDYAQIQKLVRFTALLENALKENSTDEDFLNIIFESYTLRQKLELTAEQKKKIAAKYSTEQGKKMLAAMKQMMQLQRAELKKELTATHQTFKITGAEVNGEQAVVICEYISAKEKKREISTVKLRKTTPDGKWLIFEERNKYADEAAPGGQI